MNTEKNKLSRQELVKLVEKIMRAEDAPAEGPYPLLDLFESNVPHPRASGLVYWPETEGLSAEPTATEVVEAALSYKPVQLDQASPE